MFRSTTQRSMRLGNEKSRLESTPPILAVCRHFVSVFLSSGKRDGPNEKKGGGKCAKPYKNKCRTKDKCAHTTGVVPHRDRKEEQYPNGRVTIRNLIKKSGRHLEKVDRIIGGE